MRRKQAPTHSQDTLHFSFKVCALNNCLMSVSCWTMRTVRLQACVPVQELNGAWHLAVVPRPLVE